MIKGIHNIKNRASRGVFSAFLILIILGAFFYNINPAQGANNFISNIQYYGENNKAWLSFYTNTTFSRQGDNWYEYDGNYKYGEYEPALQLCEEGAEQPIYWTNPTFTAGHYYKLFLAYDAACTPVQPSMLTSDNYIVNIGAYNNSDTWMENTFSPPWKDTEKYYFTEFPTLTITYPFDDAEIAEAFNIQGTYTIPAGSGFEFLTAYFRELGEAPFFVYYFQQVLLTESGDVDIRISGIPKSTYYISFFFSGGGNEPYNPGVRIENLKIVKTIPFEMPETGEIPPEFFSLFGAQKIYEDYSNYETPTALFTALAGAIEPILITLGDNLTFFSTQFNQDDAKMTGQDIGNAILVVRAYAGNLNSFFSDLPVSEVLFFYLLLLIVVAIFRIIRQVIKLIPFT